MTLNPYHYQNYGEDLHDGLAATLHLRDSVYMSPQLVNLTNTLRSKKKMCQGSHLDEQTSDVVFRAVSPHGHVYWEIEPKNLRHIPNPSGEQIYVSSRQSSSRYSDNHPLIQSGNTSDTSGSNTVLVNPFADVQLLPVSATSSPLHRPEVSRFGSLRNSAYSPASKLFTNRSNSARAAKMRDIAKQIETLRIQRQSSSTINTSTTGPNSSSGSTSPSNSAVVPEQLQQQVQIRDLKTITMNTSDQHHQVLAKIQNVINEEANCAGLLNRNSPKQRKV